MPPLNAFDAKLWYQAGFTTLWWSRLIPKRLLLKNITMWSAVWPSKIYCTEMVSCNHLNIFIIFWKFIHIKVLMRINSWFLDVQSSCWFIVCLASYSRFTVCCPHPPWCYTTPDTMQAKQTIILFRPVLQVMVKKSNPKNIHQILLSNVSTNSSIYSVNPFCQPHYDQGWLARFCISPLPHFNIPQRFGRCGPEGVSRHGIQCGPDCEVLEI